MIRIDDITYSGESIINGRCTRPVIISLEPSPWYFLGPVYVYKSVYNLSFGRNNNR